MINSALDSFDKAVKDAEEHLREDQVHKYGSSWAIKKGFHAVPSLDNVHLHVITNDFVSDRLKNKKHYNSFTTDFFVLFDDVVRAVEEGSKDVSGCVKVKSY